MEHWALFFNDSACEIMARDQVGQFSVSEIATTMRGLQTTKVDVYSRGFAWRRTESFITDHLEGAESMYSAVKHCSQVPTRILFS
jgi:hypothetical protein